MKDILIKTDKALTQVSRLELEAIEQKMAECNRLLHSGEGAGSDFLGWVNLPSEITQEDLSQINQVAEILASKAEVVVVIGIGGSYLGAKAVLEALGDSFGMLRKKRTHPHVIFAGQNLSQDYTWELMEMLKDYSLATIVISKSGTTTEPAIAFRIIKEEIERRYGKQDAAQRIVAVTDTARGALRELVVKQGYKSFVIEDNVGGRFSVLTPVGLLPLAVAGVDIEAFVQGARAMQERCCMATPVHENPAIQYAAVRNALYKKGKKIEILASYEPKLQNIGEWWKQLYGESEGKQGMGIFPASVTLTADLHSMGQYIQDGERLLMETVISVAEPQHHFQITADPENLDGLNFLAGKSISQVNRMAQLGTMLAHVDGGVANIEIEIPRIDAHSIGALLYMFEKACGISGYYLGVNPFDQPGVEEYKRNMFALLDKPGFQEAGRELRKRL